MKSKELKWVSCSKDASWSASQTRHLIFPGQFTTLCGCTASHVEVWRGNSLKPQCSECVKVLKTMADLERPEDYVMTPVELPVEAEMEYEYNIEETDSKTGEVHVYGFWGTLDYNRGGIMRHRAYEKNLADYGDGIPKKTFAIVRRPLVGYEVMPDE